MEPPTTKHSPGTLPAHVVTILTIEHYNLQSGRAMPISEANGRASLFVRAVSSGLIALTFVGQISHLGQAFFMFNLLCASFHTLRPLVVHSERTDAKKLSGLLALFGWESGHLNKNSRGLANKTAMLLQESGIRPDQLPRLKTHFELAYPKVTRYMPMALANHAAQLAVLL